VLGEWMSSRSSMMAMSDGWVLEEVASPVALKRCGECNLTTCLMQWFAERTLLLDY
jgi:hypothetical protein